MEKKELLHFDSNATPPFWDDLRGINYVGIRDLLKEKGIFRDADNRLCLHTPEATVPIRIKEVDYALFRLMIEKDAPMWVFREFFSHLYSIRNVMATIPKLPDYKYNPNVMKGRFDR